MEFFEYFEAGVWNREEGRGFRLRTRTALLKTDSIDEDPLLR